MSRAQQTNKQMARAVCLPADPVTKTLTGPSEAVQFYVGPVKSPVKVALPGGSYLPLLSVFSFFCTISPFYSPSWSNDWRSRFLRCSRTCRLEPQQDNLLSPPNEGCTFEYAPFCRITLCFTSSGIPSNILWGLSYKLGTASGPPSWWQHGVIHFVPEARQAWKVVAA